MKNRPHRLVPRRQPARLGVLVSCLFWMGCGAQETDTDDTSGGERFAAHSMPESIQNGGYIDSTFINKAGDRIYFLHSIWSPRVLSGQATPETCSHLEADPLPGHNTASGLEWNTDLYYVEWEDEHWSEPVNLGATINSLGMECCIWLNEDETEIIFNTLSDLDNDGVDGDLGLRPTGNYRATRANRDAEWSTPVALPGRYGTEGQSANVWLSDIEKVPSGNLYLWEQNTDGDNLLAFGERTGGTYDEPTYANPVNIDGSTNYETQVWVNDTETQLVFNHRQANGQTKLYTRERESATDPWGDSSTVSTPGFEDENGNNIWGEPSFDATESFILLTRFNTQDPDCWEPDLLWAQGDVSTGYPDAKVLN